MRTKYKLLAFVATLLLGISVNTYALPFIIVPDGSLPTTVPEDGTVDAAYTVTNNTRQTRTGNFVKYLPPNVTQNTGSGCGATFDLASDASCVLNLVISGAVDANDPDPHHHLFVCMSDGFTCAGTNFPLNVTVNPNPPAGAQYPLLGVSSNGGVTWSYALDATSTLPTAYLDLGVFNGVNCSTNSCLVAGSYAPLTNFTNTNGEISRFVQAPLLGVGSSTGGGWSYVIDATEATLPSQYNDAGVFNDARCSGANCVAAGNYMGDAGVGYMMLASSTNSGSSWTYVIEQGLNLPTDFDSTDSSQLAILSDATCAGASCMAVGYYTSTDGGNPIYPVIAHSSGGAFTYAISGNGVLPSAYTSHGELNAVGCTGSGNTAVCTAVGSYISSGITYPLLARSSNGGATWGYGIDSVNPPSAISIGGGQFASTSCTGATSTSICIAAGTYSNGSEGLPLLALSTNGAATWTYPVESGGSAGFPGDFLNGGIFNGASCTGTTTTAICVAAGSYNNGVASYPMLIVSRNGGSSWTYVVDSTTNLPPHTDWQGASFTSASCEGTTGTAVCTASGAYLDGSGFVAYPMTIVSRDGGATWGYVIDETAGTLPTDFNSDGLLYSASCTSSVCITGGSYVNNASLNEATVNSQEFSKGKVSSLVEWLHDMFS